MSLLNVITYITWDIDPDIFVFPIIDHPVRWYGLFFALAFLISQQIMNCRDRYVDDLYGGRNNCRGQVGTRTIL